MKYYLVTDDIEKVKKFYDGKYSVLLEALTEANASCYSIANPRSKLLKLSCSVAGERLNITMDKFKKVFMEYVISDENIIDFPFSSVHESLDEAAKDIPKLYLLKEYYFEIYKLKQEKLFRRAL